MDRASKHSDRQKFTFVIKYYICNFWNCTITLHYCYYYYYNCFTALWILSGTIWVSHYQQGKTRKVKTNLDLLEHKTVRDSIIWAICKFAPRPRQTATPTSHHSVVFTGQMPFLPPNQQHQNTEGNAHPSHFYLNRLDSKLFDHPSYISPYTNVYSYIFTHA